MSEITEHLTVFRDVEQHSDEWLEQRRGIVTASVVGQLLTVSTLGAIGYPCPECEAPAGEPCRSRRAGAAPIKTLHSERASVAYANRDTAPLIIEPATNDTSRGLTALLVAERITGRVEPTFTNDDMWRGLEAEPYARDKYAEDKGVDVEQVGFMVRHFDGGVQIGYSPDGLVGDDGLIEVKAPRAKNHLRTILSGEVPVQHMPQLQAGLLVSGREWVDFISFYGGMPMWVKRVTPDPQWAEAIVAAVREFEDTAEEMALAYRAATKGLPMTERIDLEMVI